LGRYIEIFFDDVTLKAIDELKKMMPNRAIAEIVREAIIHYYSFKMLQTYGTTYVSGRMLRGVE